MIFSIVTMAFEVYFWIIFIYIIMSWIPGARDSSVGRFLERICDPYLSIFRKVIPPIGVIDISPIVAIFALQLAERGVLSLLSLIL